MNRIRRSPLALQIAHPMAWLVFAAMNVPAQITSLQLFQRQQQQQNSTQPSLFDQRPPDCPDGTPTIDCIQAQDDLQTFGRQRPPGSSSQFPNRLNDDDEVIDSNGNPQQRPRQTDRRIAPEPPTEFQQFVQSMTGRLLPIYGSSLFDRVPSTFAPMDRIPVPPNYTIGPGDEINLRVWGQVDFARHFTVDPNGNMFLPQIGRISVSGLTFGQLEEAVRSSMSRVYRNFDLNVSMGQLRSMQIFVLGQARRPGSYTVSSLSTLVNALFASGGPSARGSLRSIQLKRGNRVATTIDLYDLLLKGDKTSDIQLVPGDVIFIPEAGPRVAVEGSVESPAIYELKDDSSLSDLLTYAGGLSPSAAGQRAWLERIDDHASLRSEEIGLDQSGLKTPLHTGDIVQILPLVPQFQRTVSLRGNVADPVRLPWHAGMKVSDLIPNKEALLTRGYWREHNDLRGQSDRDKATQLDDLDGIKPYEDPKITNQSSSSAAGNGRSADFRDQVRKTDTDQGIASSKDNTEPLTIREFVRKNDIRPAAPDIDWNYAAIERLSPEDLTTRILPFNLGEAVLKHNPAADLLLEAGDVVTIMSSADVALPITQQTKYVRIEGEVTMAGVYSVKSGETLHDLVTRAGGLTPKAYLFASQFTRESTRREQQQRYNDFLNQLEHEINQSAATVSGRVTSVDQSLATQASLAGQRTLLDRLRTIPVSGRIVLDMQPDSSGVSALPNLPLENGDRLYVPSVPSTVNVVGMVYNQAAFVYDPAFHLGDYLTDAGGPSRYADQGHSFVIRADGSVISRNSRSKLFSSKFETLRMYPGDTLVMPTNVNKVTFLRGLIDWSQVISSFGIGVAAINVLR